MISAKFLALVAVEDEEIERRPPVVKELLITPTATLDAADAVIPNVFPPSVPLPTIVCF